MDEIDAVEHFGTGRPGEGLRDAKELLELRRKVLLSICLLTIAVTPVRFRPTNCSSIHFSLTTNLS